MLRAPGPSTPDAAPKRAARGGGSNGLTPLRLDKAPSYASTARACCRFESCERAHAPRPPRRCRRNRAGGCHAACAWVGMTRTDNKPLYRNGNAARAALSDERARAMRASLTPSEALLWARIRGCRLGPVFRRQVPLLGRFIADFLAPAERLVIEVDGGHHAEQARAGTCFASCLRLGPAVRAHADLC